MKFNLFPLISLAALFLLRGFSQHAFADALPSEQLKPILEPCLDAILSPLETNPAMPRVKVEIMRANFAASMVVASTPAEKQVYRNAMAVCDAMTSDMDARAKAQARAQASAEMPTLSTGGDIIASMPMHGRNPGPEGHAIRKKQKEERRDANRRAQRESAFTDSGAYTSWVNNGPNLRAYVMGLYTRQVELEALYNKSLAAASRLQRQPRIRQKATRIPLSELGLGCARASSGLGSGCRRTIVRHESPGSIERKWEHGRSTIKAIGRENSRPETCWAISRPTAKHSRSTTDRSLS